VEARLAQAGEQRIGISRPMDGQILRDIGFVPVQFVERITRVVQSIQLAECRRHAQAIPGSGHVSSEQRDQVKVKGFARPVQIYQIGEFLSEAHCEKRQQLSRVGKHVEVNVIDSSDMQALIEELREIQEDFQKKLSS
jgi:hypothetical protein